MITQGPGATTVLPPDDLAGLLDLSRFLTHVTEPAALLGPDGETVPLPMEFYQVLVKVAEAMRLGKAITVAPMEQRMTTQQAADFLGISRPTLVKLLERGEIPFDQPGAGRHRRVRLNDILEYQNKMHSRQRTALDELTEEGAAAGLYDNVPDYREALRQARQELAR